jgi:hypothetical protein
MTLKASTCQAASSKLCKIAADLDARCRPQTPRQKAALTSTVNGLARYARRLFEMNILK